MKINFCFLVGVLIDEVTCYFSWTVTFAVHFSIPTSTSLIGNIAAILYSLAITKIYKKEISVCKAKENYKFENKI